MKFRPLPVGHDAARCLLGALPFLACTLQVPPVRPLPQGDLATFEAEVQPVLDADCASPSCHGQPERPFSVFSPGRYRRDAARTFLEEPLAREELAANVRNAAAFRADEPVLDECLLLCRPLAVTHGGCGHGAGSIFGSRDDSDYRALRAWLAALRFPD